MKRREKDSIGLDNGKRGIKEDLEVKILGRAGKATSKRWRGFNM